MVISRVDYMLLTALMVAYIIYIYGFPQYVISTGH